MENQNDNKGKAPNNRDNKGLRTGEQQNSIVFQQGTNPPSWKLG